MTLVMSRRCLSQSYAGRSIGGEYVLSVDLHAIMRVIAHLAFAGLLTSHMPHVACPDERLRELRGNVMIFIVDRVTHNVAHDSLLDSPSSHCTAKLSVRWPLTLGLRSSEDVALTRWCGRTSRCLPPGSSGAVGSPHPTRQPTDGHQESP